MIRRFDWKWSRGEKSASVLLSRYEVKSKIECFSRHGEQWWHIRVFVPATGPWAGDGKWMVLHDAMKHSQPEAQMEAERAMRAIIKMDTQGPDPIRELLLAVEERRMPSLLWVAEYGQSGADPAVSAWNASLDAIGMIDLAKHLKRADGTYHEVHVPCLPVSRILNGLCCAEAIWSDGHTKRYEILRSKAQSDDIRRRLKAPTFEQCLSVIKGTPA